MVSTNIDTPLELGILFCVFAAICYVAYKLCCGSFSGGGGGGYVGSSVELTDVEAAENSDTSSKTDENNDGYTYGGYKQSGECPKCYEIIKEGPHVQMHDACNGGHGYENHCSMCHRKQCPRCGYIQ